MVLIHSVSSNRSVSFQNYIARFGHGSAKLARQAQSKEKTLKKMVDGGLTERVAGDKVTTIDQVTFPHFSLVIWQKEEIIDVQMWRKKC